MVLHFISRCFHCIQRNLHSSSTLSRPIQIYYQTMFRHLNTLSHIIRNQNVIYRTSPSRLLYLAAVRQNQLGLGGDRHDQQTHSHDKRSEEKASNSAWTVRLAIENGYLSWCRNTYLATVVGVAMQAEGIVAMSQHAAEGAFFIAGLNLMWGSGTFISNTIILRRQIQMSRLTALFQVTATLLHCFLWACIVFLYLGSGDEEIIEILEIPEDSLPESAYKSV